MKIGAITVGQSPRTDVTEDIMPIFNGKVELIEKGALDDLTFEEIQTLAPMEGDYVLVSRLKDGRQVTFAERLILDRLQQCVEELEQQGVSLILFFCTGEFSHQFQAKVPIIYPCHILHQLVPILNGGLPVIIVNPSPDQKKQSQEKWGRFIDLSLARFLAATPYGEERELLTLIKEIKKIESNMVVLDCIGYTQEMKDLIAKETGKMVVLPRTLLARVVSELTGINI